jgi:cytochrome c biogenesis protein CcmG, thiol:disulfide interchange protein DsbE
MTAQPSEPEMRRNLTTLLPFAIFLGIAALFFVSLKTGDPSRLPSTLIGKSTPAFNLPPLDGFELQGGLSNADLAKGGVTIVNVFASWCVPCRDEHPILMQLSRNTSLIKQGMRIAGVAYKDDPMNSRKFLSDFGNPYTQIGVDQSGRAGIEWGVYGVPETFVVRGDGTIAYKFVGPLSMESMREKLIPEIEKAIR